MDRQIIIAIGREYGSGGHEIAARLAEDLGIKLYDRNLLDEIADRMDFSAEQLLEYDEKPMAKPIGKRVGSINSPEDRLARVQFGFLKEKADAGESFVAVGRCSESVLRRYNVISVFVLGDMKQKVKRIMDKYELMEEEAVDKINRHDRTRKRYHDTYSEMVWGDARGYDLCLNSSKLGIDGAVSLIKDYIELRNKV